MERSLESSEGVRSLVLSKSLGGGTRVLLEEQVGWGALYILLAYVEFSWVPSATLISALGLRLPRSVSSTGTSPTRVTVGRAARPIAGAAPRSTPSLQRAGTHVNCDPQLTSPSLAAGIFQ